MLAHAFSLLALFALLALSLPLTWIDLREYRLPDRLVLPAYPVALVLLVLAAWFENSWDALGRALLAGLVLFSAYFLLRLANSSGLGGGDVKLAGVLGLILGWLGWPQVLVATMFAFIVGAIFALVGIAIRKLTLKSHLAFGPFMLAGAWIVVVPAIIARF